VDKLYKILGLEPGANKSEIKKAYREQALKHHPDTGGSEEIFKFVTMAYEILSGKRKPNRLELQKYGNQQEPSKPKPPEKKKPQPPEKEEEPVTQWPPPHLKQYWKGKLKANNTNPNYNPSGGTQQNVVVHDPNFWKKLFKGT